MVNKVTLIGNLGKAPEVKTLESGAKVAKFPLATNESYKDKSGEWQTQTEWHDIVLWNKLAEKAEHLTKGETVYLEGKVISRTWQDKDGNNRKNTEIVANYFRTIGKRNDSEGATTAQKSQVGTSEPANDDWLNEPYPGDENLSF